MNNTIIRRVILLGTVAMIGIISMQAYWVISTWNLNETEFNDKVNLSLYNVARQLAKINGGSLPGRDIVKKRSSNYYVVNVNDVIGKENLEYFLQKEFESKALNIDFEYAIYDCSSNEMVYGGFCDYNSNDKKHELELGNLPKDKEFTYYFGVKFPTRSGYLFGKMQLSIFFSVILMLTTLFFVYTMFIILRQKRLSEMQKDFINNMTHEFKTPISTIKIAADVFINDEAVQKDQRLSRYANIIKEQDDRLNSQVEKVLQISKIEGSGFELKKERIDLIPFLENTINSCRVRTTELNGSIETDMPDTPVWIYADPVHLGNILNNLLDNAIKYRRENVPPEIKISVDVAKNKIKLRILDNGIGIEEHHLSKVFNKFFRVPTGNIHNVKGFGLGLYYVKSICDAHHWNIAINSEKDVGTEVTIEMKKA